MNPVLAPLSGQSAAEPEFDFDHAWEEDSRGPLHPAVLTGLLREQVPVLDYVDWGITHLPLGGARSVLPLLTESTNQHCTHQAALLLLAADYTGGAALSTLLAGWPLLGVHPATSDRGVALWLARGEIKYLSPSYGRLEVSASIPADRHPRIRQRFLRGKAVVETVTVEFRNGDTAVAAAEMTYFARRGDRLRDDGIDPDDINGLYRHKLTSAAEMIAGVRARHRGGLFEDPWAAAMAGEHGLALADRFAEKLPQLGGMVAARTRHLDDHLRAFLDRGGRQVVLLGAGYDMRPFRLGLPPGTTVIEVDLPAMLADREDRIERIGAVVPAGVGRVPVPLDLRGASLPQALLPHLRSEEPVFVVWEGMTMYLKQPDVVRLLGELATILHHPDSRLWADFVDARVISDPTVPPGVAAFLRGMQTLGEPFRFGSENAADLLRQTGLDPLEITASSKHLNPANDPVFGLYYFTLSRRSSPASRP